jgi:hypothetical protein
VSIPDAFSTGFVDDATALLPDSAVCLAEAATAFEARASDERQGGFLAPDTDVPQLRGFAGPLTVVVTGGAGQIAGPAGLCTRLGLSLTRLHVTLRDPGDLRGNARRVVAAVDDALEAGALDEATEICIEVPGGSEAGWLDAADEVAAAEHRLALRPGASASVLVRWIDASLDRETTFTVHGLARAVTRSSSGPGFLNVLVATQLLFDGGSDPVGALAETDASALLGRTNPQDLLRARRWFTSFASEDVEASLHDIDLLLEGWTAG